MNAHVVIAPPSDYAAAAPVKPDVRAMVSHETVLSPRFYTTDFAEMDRTNVDSVRKEWDILIAELKSRVPGVTYMPQTGTPPHTEAADPAPEYNLPGGNYAARLVPGDGLWLTLAECID